MEIESISGTIGNRFYNCKLLKVPSQNTNLAQRKSKLGNLKCELLSWICNSAWKDLNLKFNNNKENGNRKHIRNNS